MDTRVARFSVSLDKNLLRQRDRMLREKAYENRTLAVANMVRERLVEHQQEVDSNDVVARVKLVYDHHNCFEVLVLRGKASEIRALADRLIAVKGVKHGRLALTTTGKNLPA